MHSLARNALLLAATALPSALSAQGVIVQSVSDITLYGALGKFVDFAARRGGGNMHAIKSTTSVSGHKLRAESADAATIIDADAGRLTTLDLKQKTYTSMTFAEMAAALERAAEAKRQDAQKEAANKSRDAKSPKGDVDFKTSVSVERPGQREKIAGYDAERVFVTITIEGEATPEGEKTEQVGSLVFLIDQWIAKDAPQAAALQEFQRAYAQKAGQAFRPPMEALQAAFASDPRLKVGFEASAKELQKLSGIPLRSVTYAALVPAALAFDRKLVLDDGSAPKDQAAKADEKPKSRFGSLVGAVKSAAQEAAKQPADKNESQPKQTTVLSVKDEVTSIDRGAVPPETFEVPAGYREVKPRTPSP